MSSLSVAGVGGAEQTSLLSLTGGLQGTSSLSLVSSSSLYSCLHDLHSPNLTGIFNSVIGEFLSSTTGLSTGLSTGGGGEVSFWTVVFTLHHNTQYIYLVKSLEDSVHSRLHQLPGLWVDSHHPLPDISLIMSQNTMQTWNLQEVCLSRKSQQNQQSNNCLAVLSTFLSVQSDWNIRKDLNKFKFCDAVHVLDFTDCSVSSVSLEDLNCVATATFDTWLYHRAKLLKLQIALELCLESYTRPWWLTNKQTGAVILSTKVTNILDLMNRNIFIFFLVLITVRWKETKRITKE